MMIDPRMQKRLPMKPAMGGRGGAPYEKSVPWGEVVLIMGGESSDSRPQTPLSPGAPPPLKQMPQIPGVLGTTGITTTDRQQYGQIPTWGSPWGGGRFDRNAIGDAIWSMGRGGQVW